MELNLLKKTELRITNIALTNANLNVIAQAVAEVLGLPHDKVLVIDVRTDHICLDLLEKTLDMHQVVGKEQAILDRLKTIQGLHLTEETRVDSAGIMGLIGADDLEAEAVIEATTRMTNEIERNVLSRALIFSTGFEVKQGMIEDTNSPFLLQFLKELGYRAEFGGILDDDISAIRYQLSDAADRGIGLVMTTGGVGAEDKDFTVEAITTLDREAATPWLAKFEKGTGRHVKEGIRIGVGQVGLTTYVALPGPHDEVVAAAGSFKNLCHAGKRIDKMGLANAIAHILREKLRGKHMGNHYSSHHHYHN
jgi:molybdenum cofactor synthesis domain-containing protein